MTPCVVCQSPEHRTGDHVWTEEDGAREVAALSRPATDHGITNAILRQEHTPRPATDPAGLDVLLAEGIEAFRLTREYVGEDTLPAIEGWSWFDWTEKAKARLSAADGPGPEERLDLEAVYAVVFSNYEPAETDSLWRDKAKAEARAEELNSGKTTGWDVVKWTLSDAALPVEETGR